MLACYALKMTKNGAIQNDPSESRFYKVVMRTAVPLEPDSEAGDYISKIEAEIVCQTLKDGDVEPEETHAGRMIAYRIFSGRAMNDGVSLFDECDAYEQVTLDYYRLLFDDDGEFLPAVDRMFPDTFGRDVLILDLIEIAPEHRGRRVGLLAARRLMNVFEPDDGLVVCKPFPLQFDSMQRRSPVERASLGLEGFSCTEAQAYRRLREYWSRLGFRRLGRSPYFALSPVNVHPTFEQLYDSELPVE